MATFKVGQRVRVIRTKLHPETLWREATVIGALRIGLSSDGSNYMGYPIDIDGFGTVNRLGGKIIAEPTWIAPLTDPAADAFLESIRKMKPYDEPKVEKLVAKITPR